MNIRLAWVVAVLAIPVSTGEARSTECALAVRGPALDATPRRGVNLTEPPDQLSTSDLRDIKALGLDHVRIPVDPAVALAAQAGDQTSAARLAGTFRLACAALQSRLLVILDMHPASADLTLTDANAAQATPRLIAAWAALGKAFAKLPTSGLLLEVLNEPQVHDTATWDRAQASLLAAAKAAFPGSLPILTASPFDTAVALQGLKPVPLARVLYAFHFYSPMVFTHQSAAWTLPSYAEVKGLTFPPDAGNIDLVSSRVSDPAILRQLTDYRSSAGGTNPLQAQIRAVARWARANHVQVVATELGVIKDAPAPSRNAWLRQARSEMEATGIGWTLWEWRGGFGIAGPNDGRCQIDSATLALALCR